MRNKEWLKNIPEFLFQDYFYEYEK